MLLYKAVHQPQEVSEQSLALIIYLADLAASLALQQLVIQGNVSLLHRSQNFLILVAPYATVNVAPQEC